MQFVGTYMTEEALAKLRESNADLFEIEVFTCDDCPARKMCHFVFDPYNTDGDCLAEK